MGYAFGQCTWGVAARINQLGLKLKGRNGEKISITSVMGNGQDWVRSAAALGGETGSTPRAGAIISFAGGSHGTLAEYGHALSAMTEEELVKVDRLLDLVFDGKGGAFAQTDPLIPETIQPPESSLDEQIEEARAQLKTDELEKKIEQFRKHKKSE